MALTEASVFPSWEPGVSGEFSGSQEGCQGPFRPSGRNRGLSDFTFTFHFHALEKEMATHSSVLAWSIPGLGEPAMQSRDHCLPWRGILGPEHTPR